MDCRGQGKGGCRACFLYLFDPRRGFPRHIVSVRHNANGVRRRGRGKYYYRESAHPK